MIDSTKYYKLEKENKELKKEIENLIELCNKYKLEHKHGNGDEELILAIKILNKHIKEIKESDE